MMKALARFAAAALMATALVACSDDDSTGRSGDSTPTPSGSAATDETACAALDSVKSAASTLESDLKAKDFAAAKTDVNTLEASLRDLRAALSSGAQAGADELDSAWDSVKSTFQGLSASDLGSLQSTMQAPVAELKTTLEGLGSDLSCS